MSPVYLIDAAGATRVFEDGQELEDLVVDGLLALIGDMVELVDKTGDVQ